MSTAKVLLMLSASVAPLLRDQIKVDLNAGRFNSHAIGQRALGNSFMGAVIQQGKFLHCILSETRSAGDTIVSAIEKVINQVPIRSYPDFANDLLGIFDAEWAKVLIELRQSVSKEWPKISNTAVAHAHERFEAEATQIRASKEIQIKLIAANVAKNEMSEEKAVTTLIVQDSQIGAIQIGKTNTVSGATINFDSRQVNEIVAALRSIEGQLVETKEIAPAMREQLKDVATDAQKELQKPQPNGLKLRGLFSTIMPVIKGIASFADAYTKIASALELMGVKIG